MGNWTNGVRRDPLEARAQLIAPRLNRSQRAGAAALERLGGLFNLSQQRLAALVGELECLLAALAQLLGRRLDLARQILHYLARAARQHFERRLVATAD